MVRVSIFFAVTSLLVTTCVAQAIYEQDICVTTFAGNYNNGKHGYREGPKISSLFSTINGITVDTTGNIYVGDFGNCRVRIINTKGIVSTLVGINAIGHTDQDYTKSSFNGIFDVKFDTVTGNIYVCDTNLVRVLRKGVVKTVAGNATHPGLYQDGQGASAGLSCTNLNIYKGDLYFGDFTGNTVRRVNATGYVSTVVGRRIVDQHNVPLGSFSNGPVSQARFNWPYSIVFDTKGRMFVSDSSNGVVRVIVNGTMSTFAGGDLAHNSYPIRGYRDGPGNQALFNNPGAMIIDANDNIYLVDANLVRKIDATGYVTTIAGQVKSGTKVLGYKDGSGKNATFLDLSGLAFYKNELYVGDFNLVRKITFSQCK